MPTGAAAAASLLLLATTTLLQPSPASAFVTPSGYAARRAAGRHHDGGLTRGDGPPSRLRSTNPAQIDGPLSILAKSRESDRSNDLMVGEDAGAYDFADESWGALGESGWLTFFAAVATILTAVAVLWIYPPTGYGDDFVNFLETDVAHGNPHLVTLAFGIIFPIVHSGLASLRPLGEKVVGARIWRVIFAFPSLCLAFSWIVYFISHAHDGIQFYDIRSIGWVHSLAWVTNFLSFLFLYPSVYNLKEVAAVEKPTVHLWETGVIRITRHPQVGAGVDFELLVNSLTFECRNPQLPHSTWGSSCGARLTWRWSGRASRR